MSDLEAPRKAPTRLWASAALGALALHVACVAIALATMEPDDSDDDVGAIAIEVGYEFAAPRLPDSDLPPGPEAEASDASPEVMAQQEEVKPTDAPKDVPIETPEPDRVVSPNDPKEVTEEEQKVPVIEAVVAAVASEATAPPASEVIPEGPRSVSPAQGVGQSDRRVRLTWQKELMAHLNRYKRYPADRSGRSAEIVVSFALDRSGHILSTGIVRGSGDASFDEAALAMLKRSNPVPAPPPLVADEGLNFTLPVFFRIKGRN